MSLSPDTLEKIANLARIHMNHDELQDVREKLEGIFHLIDEMQSVNTAGVAPMSHARDQVAYLRVDEVSEPNQREKFQRGAPDTQDGYYLVPKVIE